MKLKKNTNAAVLKREMLDATIGESGLRVDGVRASTDIRGGGYCRDERTGKLEDC